MKIRPSIWVLVVIFVVAALIFIWYGKQSAETPLPMVAETNNAPSSLVHSAAGPGEGAHSPVGQTGSNASTPAAPAQSKASQMREGLAALNDDEIVLYGRIIDQFDAPVAGAEVVGTIQVNNGFRVGTDRLSIKSDAKGLFVISGRKGKNLGIAVTKPGYALATMNTSFVYSHLWPEAERYKPDANNPAVFRMWKLQGTELLMVIDQRYKFPVTGTPVNFDLLAGKTVPTGGDIKITVIRAPGFISGRSRLDWSVELDAIDGGLIETSMEESRITYQAPDSGYQPTDTMIMSTNAPHKWFGGFDQMFFLKSRVGQLYSKVFISFNINENPDEPMSATFRGVANTNGSRNWEGDPNTMK